MDIAFIGGTRFVGRHMVDAAINRGHTVTVFHRGRTNSGLFPGADSVHGDRSTDLSRLATRHYDAVIDTSAYLPSQVATAARELGSSCDRYLYVSSISAYRPTDLALTAEDAPRWQPSDLDDPAKELLSPSTYGPFESLCEDAAVAGFGADRTIVVRPTYVIGPEDYSDRLTWFVRRIAMGGPVLVAGPPDGPIQVIDGRDLGALAVMLVEQGASGAYNGVGPAQPVGWASLLDDIAGAVGTDTTAIVWADADTLTGQGVDMATGYPLWAPLEEYSVMRCDPSKSLAAGMALRPVADTARDLWAWDQQRGLPPLRQGLSDERHAELLALLGAS